MKINNIADWLFCFTTAAREQRRKKVIGVAISRFKQVFDHDIPAYTAAFKFIRLSLPRNTKFDNYLVAEIIYELAKDAKERLTEKPPKQEINIKEPVVKMSDCLGTPTPDLSLGCVHEDVDKQQKTKRTTMSDILSKNELILFDNTNLLCSMLRDRDKEIAALKKELLDLKKINLNGMVKSYHHSQKNKS